MSVDVALVVLDYVAVQVEVKDPSCAKRYTQREPTPLRSMGQSDYQPNNCR